MIGTLCRSSQSGDLTLTPANLINEELKKEILIQAETFAKKWETAPKNSGLDYFDPQKGIFISSNTVKFSAAIFVNGISITSIFPFL